MKKMQTQVLAIFMVLFIIFGSCVVFFSTQLMQNYVNENQQEDLLEQSKLVLSNFDGLAKDKAAFSDLKEEAIKVKEYTNQRITLIDLNGTVIYDSKIDNYVSLENHSNRKEIQAIIKGESQGTDSRTSESTKKRLYYVAQPVLSQSGQLIGVLRLAKPSEEVNQLNGQIMQSIVMFIFLALLLTAGITFLIAKYIAKPIEEVMNVAKKLSDNHYEVRFSGNGYGEINKLGQTINELAESLDDQMQEIDQNKERINELINHLVIGVMQLDEHRNIQIVNPAMCQIFDMDSNKLIGKSYAEATKSYGLSYLIEKAYRKKEIQNKEIYFYFPSERIVDANVVPIAGKTKEDMNLIVLLYDITEIRRLEKVRTDFVTNASHELRTPITALKGFSETLLDGAMEDKVILKQFLEIMLEESTRLNLLVNDILELSKLEQRQVPISFEEVVVKEAVLSTFKLMNQKAEQKKITMNLFEEDSVKIEGDKNRLKQILANLVDNAVIYTKPGGTIDVTVKKNKNKAMITISDNGMGIPEDEINRIFERFYRVDKGRSRNSGGTGLGLSIVKYLVENSNGKITVESKVGLGTTFALIFPLRHL
ncbi:two-component system, OmpR family, phosphate regulon sensor histidine kinase PhoR [Carnobacterium iners]|uniref:histidine kinase n=1 Tax=Carnobacterium iners TaxID=1073423 RepID=A0A1X7MQJ7_9LACT|nr:ATP-binding protein [Carnobacterium iners]SEK87196.1 two-component system, OmpR family, phosphate regulon sensor histidine kinase PhoR [Carnobacterium iners]SMH26884.1 two-component system, OmpR family, phosphate regulon sensor histidine kinase PhoR [Carnobacterium iners]